MNLINKILVPVDGSESSKRALKYAKELAEKLPGEIKPWVDFEKKGGGLKLEFKF